MNAAAATAAHPSTASTASPVLLPKSDQNLVWLDCEMSGLDPKINRLLEVAVVITNADLSIRVESPVIVIHQTTDLRHGQQGLSTSGIQLMGLDKCVE